MAIFDTFSKRLKRQTEKATDVYVYDTIPQKIRVQAATIVAKALGEEFDMYGSNVAWELLQASMAEEFGYFQLPRAESGNGKAVTEYIANGQSTAEFLDSIEIAVKVAHQFSEVYSWDGAHSQQLNLTEMVADLNQRFLENAIGYRVVGDPPHVIRVDSEHLHQDVVLPALNLLADKGFEGANAEYREAQAHYMRGDYKACLNECLKAFESTMKTVCAKKKWPTKPGDTANKLIEACLSNELIPAYLQNHFASIRSALESGIPTVRNRLGGHGQGEKEVAVPRYFAEYLLHETATTMVFLLEAYKAL